MNKIRECATAIRTKLPVIKILLFGSSARGETTENSDADFLVILKDNHGLTHPCYEAKLAVAKAKTGIPNDIVIITESEEHNPNSYFIKEALKEGIVL